MKDNINLDIRALQLVLHILIIKNKFQNLKVILSDQTDSSYYYIIIISQPFFIGL